MIHPQDYEALERLFRGSEIPEDLVQEYELQRLMAATYGHVGPLGMGMVVPMMRALGYGVVRKVSPEGVDWRKHIGSEVIAQYGDRDVHGVVVGLGTNSRLDVELDGYGEVELPRYCVKLIPVLEVEAVKPLEIKDNPWATVSRGTKVVVSNGDSKVEGRFLKVVPDGLRVKVGKEEQTAAAGTVELAP
jgi:hypothetical protein